MPTKQAAVRVADSGQPQASALTTDRESIAALAYEFWIARGCAIGSPEMDWFRAEEELKTQTETARRGGLRNVVADVVSDVPVSQDASLPNAKRQGKATEPDLAALAVPEV